MLLKKISIDSNKIAVLRIIGLLKSSRMKILDLQGNLSADCIM